MGIFEPILVQKGTQWENPSELASVTVLKVVPQIGYLAGFSVGVPIMNQ